MRYYEDVIQQTAAEHWKAWQDVRLTQLNAEISVQVHSLSLKNHAKHAAIRRLYGGLRLMALVLGALMVVFAWLVWTQPDQLKLLPRRPRRAVPPSARRCPDVPGVPRHARPCSPLRARSARTASVARRFRAQTAESKGRYDPL